MENLPHLTSGVVSYYSMFATTGYLSVVGNSACYQFSLKVEYPYRDTRGGIQS